MESEKKFISAIFVLILLVYALPAAIASSTDEYSTNDNSTNDNSTNDNSTNDN
ncbi:MAG: hypothetical protein QG646_2053, partial [Euryarchaeota archaeon]|nr:hypothetical protein [Euryarchaeota archaeon]